MSVEAPVEVDVPSGVGSSEMAAFVEGLMLGTSLTGVDVSPKLQPAINPPSTSHVSGHGASIAQHPRYIPPQKL